MQKAISVIITMALVCAGGCDTPAETVEQTSPPKAWIDAGDRVENYGPSCAHATVCTILRHQGRDSLAVWWKRRHYGGEYASGMRAKMRASGVGYAACTSGDMEWVRVTLESGQLVGVSYPTGHMQTAYRIDEKYIYLLDNNDTGSPRGVPLAKFKRHWMGWAFALPEPPRK